MLLKLQRQELSSLGGIKKKCVREREMINTFCNFGVTKQVLTRGSRFGRRETLTLKTKEVAKCQGEEREKQTRSRKELWKKRFELEGDSSCFRIEFFTKAVGKNVIVNLIFHFQNY